MNFTSSWQTAAVMPQLNSSNSNLEPNAQQQKVAERQFKPFALVVDDSADIAFMLVMILQHAGYDTVMALSGADALTLAKQEHFDLVISDIGMPEMDGYALAKALRALTRYATIPMIAITGFAEYDDRDRALSAGFNTHVKKPVDPMKLTQLLEEFFPTQL